MGIDTITVVSIALTTRIITERTRTVTGGPLTTEPTTRTAIGDILIRTTSVRGYASGSIFVDQAQPRKPETDK